MYENFQLISQQKQVVIEYSILLLLYKHDIEIGINRIDKFLLLMYYFVLVNNKNDNSNSNSNSNMAAWIHAAFWVFSSIALLKTRPVKNSNPKKRIVLRSWHQHSMIHSPGIPELIHYTWISSSYFICKYWFWFFNESLTWFVTYDCPNLVEV